MTNRYRRIASMAAGVILLLSGTPERAGAAAIALTDDLALYLPFSDAVDDASGENVAMQAFNSVTFTPGIVGPAASLANPSPSDTRGASFVATASPLSLGSSDFTVQAWVNGDSLATDPNRRDPAIVSNKDWNSGSNVGWVIARGDENANTGGGIQWNFDTDLSTRIDIDLPASVAHLEDGQWHHVVVSHDRDGEAVMYFDNRVVATRNISAHDGASIDAGRPTAIGTDGAFGTTWNAFLNGSVDEVAIWRRVLDPQEVARLYNSGLGLAIPEPAGTTLVFAAALALAQIRRPARRSCSS